MGRHENFEPDDDDDLPAQFVEKFVALWARHGLPPEVLADAMLWAALKAKLIAVGPAAVAAELDDLVTEISTPLRSGHA